MPNYISKGGAWQQVPAEPKVKKEEPKVEVKTEVKEVKEVKPVKAVTKPKAKSSKEKPKKKAR